MSYSFPVLSDEELQSFPLLKPGVYDFEILKSTRKVSKNSGNDMAELNIQIWDNEGKTSSMFDYLVFSTVPLNIRKVKHFCDATGLSENYKRGELPEDLSGLSGKVQIDIQDEQPNDKGGYYPRKNNVVDYVMTDKGEVKYEKLSDKNTINTPRRTKSRTDMDLESGVDDDQDIPF